MFTDAVKDAVPMTAEIAMLGDLPRRTAAFGLRELGCLSASLCPLLELPEVQLQCQIF